MPDAYVYIRMSTAEQLKGDSLRRQSDLASRYASAHKLTVVDIMQDEVSAYTGRNSVVGKLGSFLQQIDNDEIEEGSYLLVESLDRISRENPWDAVETLQRLITKGVRVVTLSPEQMYSKDSSIQSVLPLLTGVMTFARAHEESHTKSVRGLAVRAEMRRKARGGSVIKQMIPNWLQYSKSGELEPRPECLEVMQDIFKLALTSGPWTIVKKLNERSVPTWGKAPFWQESYIKRLLVNRAVLGEYQPHKLLKNKDGQQRVPDGDPISDYYPQVIDDVIFHDVQAARIERAATGRGRKGPGLPNLFQGLLKCGACGVAMRIINKGRPPKGRKYLQCTTARLTGKCSGPRFHYAPIEDDLLRLLAGINFEAILNGPAWEANTKKLREKILECSRQIDKRQQEADNLGIALASLPKARTLLDGLDKAEQDLERLREEMKAAENELAELSGSVRSDHKALIERLSSVEIDTMERENLRKIVSGEVKKMVRCIKISRTFPITTSITWTYDENSVGDYLEDIHSSDVSYDDADTFLEMSIFYKDNSFSTYDRFRNEFAHFELGKKLNLFREKRKISNAV
jgi:DNA invertase Pin-like site-specific DNA recombinase